MLLLFVPLHFRRVAVAVTVKVLYTQHSRAVRVCFLGMVTSACGLGLVDAVYELKPGLCDQSIARLAEG